MFFPIPLKTGDSMFVGFDSQNTSDTFPHYPNWSLWVWEILLIGFRGDSETISITIETSDPFYFFPYVAREEVKGGYLGKVNYTGQLKRLNRSPFALSYLRQHRISVRQGA